MDNPCPLDSPLLVMKFKKNSLFWIASVLSVIFDQLTKYWVVQNFDYRESWPLWEGVFHLTYVTNTGAAFSLFSNNGAWLRWLSLAVSLGLMALAWFGPRMNRWEEVGFGLILGGAVGNGIDRFLLGEVIDFLDFRLINFPVFNIADISINIGIICLLIVAFRPTPPRNEESPNS
jgi:signal peptidase II